MKRLLVICHGFPPYYGGGERAAYALAREAVRSGTEVTVLTSDIGGRLPRDEVMEGLRVVRVHSRKAEWARHTAFELGWFLAAAGRTAWRLAESVRPDLVMAHFTLPAGELARGLGRRLGIPYAVVLHGSDVPGYQPERFGLLHKFVGPWVRGVWRGSASVIAVSAELRSLALSIWPGGDIHVITNGVDTEEFRPRETSETRLAEGLIRIVTVAQLIERKGVDTLIEAVALLPAELRANLVVDVYGTGPERESLLRHAGSLGVGGTIRLNGLAEAGKLPAILSGSDIFVLPSRQEGLPLALLEAMSSGLPVVATPVGEIQQVIQHGLSAMVVEPDRPDLLSDSLVRLIGDESLRRRLGREARRRAECFSWHGVWQKYLDVLEREER